MFSTCCAKIISMEREKIIVRTSIIGIVTNILLVVFKATIGLITGSIAIILDAVNNFSDVLSSVVTIVGTKLAGKRPDKDHPLGHGRFEYLAGMAVAVIILIVGGQALVESAKKIFSPGEEPSFSIASLVIIASAVFVKLALGLYVRAKGKSVKSTALQASGVDALFDSILSSSVLISALLYYFTSIRIEAYVGVIISAFIIKAGIEILLESKDDIIGRRTDSELKRSIINIICQEENVHGAYDLFIHNYGHSIVYGSVHIEIPDYMRADEIDRLERSIQTRVFEGTGVLMTGIGIYSVNTESEEIRKIQDDIYHLIHAYDGVIQTHGFYLNDKDKVISLDIILDFEIKDRDELFNTIRKDLEERYPDYKFSLTMDIDV